MQKNSFRKLLLNFLYLSVFLNITFVLIFSEKLKHIFFIFEKSLPYEPIIFTNLLLWGAILYSFYYLFKNYISEKVILLAIILFLLSSSHIELWLDLFYLKTSFYIFLSLIAGIIFRDLPLKKDFEIFLFFLISLIMIFSPIPFFFIALFGFISLKEKKTFSSKKFYLCFLPAIFNNQIVFDNISMSFPIIIKSGNIFFYELKNFIGLNFIKWTTLNIKTRYFVNSIIIFSLFLFLLKKKSFIFFLVMICDLCLNKNLIKFSNGKLFFHLFIPQIHLFISLTLSNIIFKISLRIRKILPYKKYSEIFILTFILIFFSFFIFRIIPIYSSTRNYLLSFCKGVRFKLEKFNQLYFKKIFEENKETLFVVQKEAREKYYNALINLYLGNNQKEELLRFAKEISKEKGLINLKFKIISYLISLNYLKEAQKLLSEIPTHYCNSRNYYFLKAMIYFKKGNYDKLMDLLEEKEDYLRKEDIYYFNGVLYYIKGDYKLAKESFENTSPILEKFPQAAAYLGKIYVKEGKYAQALTYFDFAYRHNYLEANFLQSYISLLFELHQFKRGMAILERALNFYPENPILYITAIYSYISLAKDYWYLFPEGNYRKKFCKKALFYVDKLLEITPQNAYLLYLKGFVYFTAKDYKNSKKYVEKSLKLQPRNKKYYIMLLKIYIVTEDANNAKKTLEKINQLFHLSSQQLQKSLTPYYYSKLMKMLKNSKPLLKSRK